MTQPAYLAFIDVIKHFQKKGKMERSTFMRILEKHELIRKRDNMGRKRVSTWE